MSILVSMHFSRDDVMIMLCDVKLIVFVNGAEIDAVPNIWKHSKHEETFLFLIFTQLTLNSASICLPGKCSSKTMFPHSNILTLQKFVLDVWSLTFFENFTLDIFYCLSESKLPPPTQLRGVITRKNVRLFSLGSDVLTCYFFAYVWTTAALFLDKQIHHFLFTWTQRGTFTSSSRVVSSQYLF